MRFRLKEGDILVSVELDTNDTVDMLLDWLEKAGVDFGEVMTDQHSHDEVRHVIYALPKTRGDVARRFAALLSDHGVDHIVDHVVNGELDSYPL